MNPQNSAPADGEPEGMSTANGQDIGLIEGDLKRAYERLTEGKREAAENAIKKTLDVGTLLIVAKGRLPHGGFLKWVRATMPFTARWGQIAMKLARYRPVVEKIIKEQSEPGSHSSLTIAKVIAVLKERGRRQPGGEDQSPEPRRPRRSKAPLGQAAQDIQTWSEPGPPASGNTVIEGEDTSALGSIPEGGSSLPKPSCPPIRKGGSTAKQLVEAYAIFVDAHSKSAIPKRAAPNSTVHTSEGPSNMGSQDQGGSTSAGTIG